VELQPRILLVEDEEHLAESISFNLENGRLSCKNVSNGALAVKVFKGEKFNLVVR